jgi:hypothetical protein
VDNRGRCGQLAGQEAFWVALDEELEDPAELLSPEPLPEPEPPDELDSLPEPPFEDSDLPDSDLPDSDLADSDLLLDSDFSLEPSPFKPFARLSVW